MKETETQFNFIVDKALKKAFEKAVGKKYMSYTLRKEMERIIKKSNQIHHA